MPKLKRKDKKSKHKLRLIGKLQRRNSKLPKLPNKKPERKKQQLKRPSMKKKSKDCLKKQRKRRLMP